MAIAELPSSPAPRSCGAPFGPGEPGLVSVVIPTFNRAYILGKAIQSVLAQTYEKIEVLVVDDGSRDNTREVVSAFDDRVRYFYKENGGVSSARNLGLREARGSFIALLDSDDEWLPWKLESQVRLLDRHSEVGMVWTDMTAIDDDGRLVRERYLREFYSAYRQVRVEQIFQARGVVRDYWPNSPETLRDMQYFRGEIFSPMLLGSLVHTSTVVMRRERVQQIGGFDETRPTPGEDYEYHLHSCYLGPVAILDVPTILYRVGNPDQLTQPEHQVRAAHENLRTLNNWLVRGKERVALTPQQVRDHLAESYDWLGREELRAGDNVSARKHLWRSLRLRAFNPWLTALFALSLLPHAVYRAIQRLRPRGRTERRDPSSA